MINMVMIKSFENQLKRQNIVTELLLTLRYNDTYLRQ